MNRVAHDALAQRVGGLIDQIARFALGVEQSGEIGGRQPFAREKSVEKVLGELHDDP